MAKNEEEVADKGKSNKILTIIIIILTVIIVGIGTFVAVYLLNGKVAQPNGKKVSSEDSNAAKSSEYSYEIKESTLNLADQNERRYIKITLNLGYGNKKLKNELEEKDHIIKDSINSIIRSKTTKDFTEKGTEAFKKEVLQRVNSELTTGKITNVYIYDILVQ